jgi:ABC-type amino acid transport substrate-binding protein
MLFDCIFSQSSVITVNYLSQVPFVTKDSTGAKGIEVDILNEYVDWLKTVKKMDVSLDLKKCDDYNAVLSETKKDQKCIGMAAAITGFEKMPEIEYLSPYLKNLSFCITNGNAPDVKTKNATEIMKTLGSMTALTIDKSNLASCVGEIKKLYVKDLKVNFLNTKTEILNSIAKNVLMFGYVDAIDFWMFLKANPNKFLKVQKSLDQSKETFSFIVPKGSEHKKLFVEFFTTFKAGVKYRLILEKYLGGFMAQNMAIK